MPDLAALERTALDELKGCADERCGRGTRNTSATTGRSSWR
jgi:hypothetical protein